MIRTRTIGNRHRLPSLARGIEALGLLDRALDSREVDRIAVRAVERHGRTVGQEYGGRVPTRLVQASGEAREVLQASVRLDLDRLDAAERHREVTAGALPGTETRHTAGRQELGPRVAAVGIGLERQHDREGRSAKARSDDGEIRGDELGLEGVRVDEL